MITYTLIAYFYVMQFKYASSATTAVAPGFLNLAACQSAGKQLMANSQNFKSDVSYLCAPTST